MIPTFLSDGHCPAKTDTYKNIHVILLCSCSIKVILNPWFISSKPRKETGFGPEPLTSINNRLHVILMNGHKSALLQPPAWRITLKERSWFQILWQSLPQFQ